MEPKPDHFNPIPLMVMLFIAIGVVTLFYKIFHLSFSRQSVSVQPPSSASQDAFGVSLGSNQFQPDALSALSKLAVYEISWVRVNLTWAEIEPTAGTMDWTKTDLLLKSLVQARKKPLVILGFTTSWDTSAPSNQTPEYLREHFPPRDYSAWDSYVVQTVSRYKNIVHTWEVWNEPDLKTFWEGTPNEYAHLLAQTAADIKKVDPHATIVLGGLALGGNTGQLDTNFFDEILSDPKFPAGKYFDVAAFHQYGTTDEAKKRFVYVSGEMQKYGLSQKPIWVTEAGVSGRNAQAAQATYLTTVLPYLLQLGVQKVFWFELFDSNPLLPFFGGTLSNSEIDQKLRQMGLYDSFRTYLANGVADSKLKSAMEKYGINPDTSVETADPQYGLFSENLLPKMVLTDYQKLIQSYENK